MQNKQLYENTASLTHFSIQDLNNVRLKLCHQV